MYLGSYSMILSFGTNGPEESSPNLLITWQNNERGMKSELFFLLLCWMFDHVHFNPPVGFCAPLPQRRAFLFGCRSLHSPASPSEESDRLSGTPPLEGSNPGQVEWTQIRFTSDSISNDSDSGLKRTHLGISTDLLIDHVHGRHLKVQDVGGHLSNVGLFQVPSHSLNLSQKPRLQEEHSVN